MSWFPIPRNIPHAVVISSDKLKALQAEAAAAPEMLEALKQIVNVWDTNPDVITYAELMRSARAAIAKATGEQP
jgi:hypothetical protein